jgi:uncharacterized RDD family membrane protein YckC
MPEGRTSDPYTTRGRVESLNADFSIAPISLKCISVIVHPRVLFSPWICVQPGYFHVTSPLMDGIRRITMIKVLSGSPGKLKRNKSKICAVRGTSPFSRISKLNAVDYILAGLTDQGGNNR